GHRGNVSPRGRRAGGFPAVGAVDKSIVRADAPHRQARCNRYPLRLRIHKVAIAPMRCRASKSTRQAKAEASPLRSHHNTKRLSIWSASGVDCRATIVDDPTRFSLGVFPTAAGPGHGTSPATVPTMCLRSPMKEPAMKRILVVDDTRAQSAAVLSLLEQAG